MLEGREAKWLFIDWVEECSRSDRIAEQLGMQLVRHHKPRGNLFSLIGKYGLLTFRTLRDLFRLRPQTIVCMSPSPLTALPVWLYAKRTGARWAIDAHSGAFIGPPWERFSFLTRFFCRRADQTFVTNEHLAAWVEAAGGTAFILEDVPTETEPPQPISLPDGFHVVLAGSWTQDEPTDIVIAAARALPRITFHLTGNPKGPAGEHLLRTRPENVVLTGHLPRKDYLALVAAADAAIALTVRDHTMQRSAYEAIYLGTPVIVSDWPILRANFESGGVVTKNTVEDLIAAISRAEECIDALRRGALELRDAKLARWSRNQTHLLGFLRGQPSGCP